MKKAKFWLILVATFWVSALISYYLIMTFSQNQESKNETVPTSISFDKKDDAPNNFLLLGYGGEGHDGGYLSDVLMLVSIDKLNKQVTLVSIPRDLWVTVPIQSDKKQNFKVNAAYAIGEDDRSYPLKEPQYRGEFGGGTLSSKVLEDALGVKIKNFAAVDFSSFENIVDLLGGVEVVVPKTFDDYFYPVKGLENETCGLSAEYIAEIHQKYTGFDLEKQFTCRYEHLRFDKGSMRMDGETALKFVRSRHSSEYGGDFARGERQNAVLYAVKDKLLSTSATKNADAIYKQFQNLVTTNVDIKSFQVLVGQLGDPRGYAIKHVGLTVDNVLIATKSSNGQFILIPKEGENKWSGVQKFVDDQITSN